MSASDAKKPLKVRDGQKSVARRFLLTQLGPKRIFEVMESELDNYSTTSTIAGVLTSITTLCLGIVIPMLSQWPDTNASTVRIGMYYGTVIGVGGLGTLCAVASVVAYKLRYDHLKALKLNIIEGEEVDVVQAGQTAPTPPALP